MQVTDDLQWRRNAVKRMRERALIDCNTSMWLSTAESLWALRANLPIPMYDVQRYMQVKDALTRVVGLLEYADVEGIHTDVDGA